MTKEELRELWRYALEVWAFELGSLPVKLVANEDRSEGYDKNEATVFELEDGKFALVIECGCSCYEPNQADIELFPTQGAAMKSFDKWRKPE